MYFKASSGHLHTAIFCRVQDCWHNSPGGCIPQRPAEQLGVTHGVRLHISAFDNSSSDEDHMRCSETLQPNGHE